MDNKKYNWWRGFLTTLLGTTIGIILTFGINRLVESYKTSQAQRQTAMMAVYDIDEIIRQLKEDKEKEDAFFEVVSYLYTNQEKIDSVSSDSLRMAVMYLLEDPADSPEWTDDSKEKTFSGGLEARQNLKHTQFYDNIRECYRLRREMQNGLEKDLVFKHPISDEYYRQFIQNLDDEELGFDGSVSEQALRKLLKQAFSQHATVLYLRQYFLRRGAYIRHTTEIDGLNRENKYLMGITEEDMAEFIRKKIDKTKPASEQLLYGEWERIYESGDTSKICLNIDKTAVHTRTTNNQLDLYLTSLGKHVPVVVPAVFSIKGKWALIGDSLKLAYDTKTSEILSLDLDLSKVPKDILEKKKDSIGFAKESIKAGFLEQFRKMQWDVTYKVSLDLTDNIIFMERDYKTPWGQTETNRDQFVRKTTIEE